MNDYLIIYDTKMFKNVQYPIKAESDKQAVTAAYKLFKIVDKIINQNKKKVIYENGNFY